jgi:hypothetical protein
MVEQPRRIGPMDWDHGVGTGRMLKGGEALGVAFSCLGTMLGSGNYCVDLGDHRWSLSYDHSQSFAC